MALLLFDSSLACCTFAESFVSACSFSIRKYVYPVLKSGKVACTLDPDFGHI